MIAKSPGRKRICVVTGELAGPDINGGIGITNLALVLFLKASGYIVDVVYTRVSEGIPFSVRGSFAEHVAAFNELGIHLFSIDHCGRWNDWQAKSFLTLQHLLSHQYDLVLFDDTHGTAYYPLLARRTGNQNLSNTSMCITTHSATQWISDLNQVPLTTIEEVRVMEMERRSLALADAVKATNTYILDKYRSYGWSLPKNCIVLPNLVGLPKSHMQSQRRTPITEVVFFGRLETRKGLWIFCRALDKIKHKLIGKTVTFLGKSVPENGVPTAETILYRAASWPFQIRMLLDFDRNQALSYLRHFGRLAVIASPEDNSPSAILECLDEKIPFIACTGSGGEELLDKQSQRKNLCSPTAAGIAAKLLQVLDEGGASATRSFDDHELQQRLSAWIQSLLPPAAEVSQPSPSEKRATPILIVLVPQEQNPSFVAMELRQAVFNFGEMVEIEVLADRPTEIQEALEADGHLLGISVHGALEFQKIALSMKYRDTTTVGISHITQILTPNWIERARICLSENTTIIAVTGMVASSHGAQFASPTAEKAKENKEFVVRYLMGQADAVLPLAHETNGGFVVLQSNLLPILSTINPFDTQYGKFKLVENWVEELLLRAHQLGNRFELIPDLLMGHPAQQRDRDIDRRGSYIRSFNNYSLEHKPGTEKAILSHIGIDIGLRRERNRRITSYLTDVESRTGKQIVEVANETPVEQDSGKLAMVAYANGQIELAIDLSTKFKMDTSSTIIPTVKELISTVANSVNLIDEVSKGKFRHFNLDNDWSMRFLEDVAQIELHPNGSDKGVAALIFPSIELRNISLFSTGLSVMNSEANPIRFILELTANNGTYRWAAETIVAGGHSQSWQVTLPDVSDLHTPCKILIGVMMADPEASSANGCTRWKNPQFRP